MSFIAFQVMLQELVLKTLSSFKFQTHFGVQRSVFPRLACGAGFVR